MLEVSHLEPTLMKAANSPSYFLILILISLGLFLVPAGAADWPQWRGPARNGISQETGLLAEWPSQGPKLRWSRKWTDCPRGPGSI